MVNVENSWEWGSGRNVLALHLLEPLVRSVGAVRETQMRLVASNRSTFNIHLTYDFDYTSLHGLRGQALFQAAMPAFEGVLPNNAVLIPHPPSKIFAPKRV